VGMKTADNVEITLGMTLYYAEWALHPGTFKLLSRPAKEFEVQYGPVLGTSNIFANEKAALSNIIKLLKASEAIQQKQRAEYERRMEMLL
jgi:hypothetical protein